MSLILISWKSWADFTHLLFSYAEVKGHQLHPLSETQSDEFCTNLGPARDTRGHVNEYPGNTQSTIAYTILTE